MRNHTFKLIVALVIVALLAIGSTVGAMALTNNRFMSNNNDNGNGMMGGQQNYSGMMGNYPQTPANQGTPVTGITHLTMQNYAFQPTNMQVKVGTTVTWSNQDNIQHSVTFKNGMKDSGLLSQGQSFSYTFNTAGTYQYYCTVHPYMVATVTVVS